MHRNASKAKRPRPFTPVTGEPEVKIIKVKKSRGIGISTAMEAKSTKRKKKK